MKIGFDIRMINYSGIGRTIREFLEHCSAEELEALTLCGHEKDRRSVARFVTAPDPVYSLRQHWRYARLLSREGLDLFHMPHYDVPFFLKGPFTATVHDLIHFKFPEFSTKPFSRVYSGAMLRHVARKARRIICVSESTRRDLCLLFPEAEPKTVTIHPGVSECFRPMSEGEKASVLKAQGLEPGYILYVGNLRASKKHASPNQRFYRIQVETWRSARIGPRWREFLSRISWRISGWRQAPEIPFGRRARCCLWFGCGFCIPFPL